MTNTRKEPVAEPIAEPEQKFDDKTEKILDKLNKLGEKMQNDKENGKMNPFKKIFLQTKLDFLESKLQRRLDKIKLNNLIERENLDEQEDIAEYRDGLQKNIDIYSQIIEDNYSLIEQEQDKINGLKSINDEKNATFEEINDSLPEGIKPIKSKNTNTKLQESRDKIMLYRQEINKAKSEIEKLVAEYGKNVQAERNDTKSMIAHEKAMMKQNSRRTNFFKNVGILFTDLGKYGKNAWTGARNVFGKIKEAIKTAKTENKENREAYNSEQAKSMHEQFIERYSGHEINYRKAQEQAAENAERREKLEPKNEHDTVK